jgi:predicted metalloprotease with PDZ domain
MLIRAGLIDQKEYLKRLSKSIESLQKNPGRGVQSLSDSSFDAWVKYYRPDENSANTRVSYYVKGGVVAFLLDARIRELTSNQKSLDDVMRLLYERHAGGEGFTDADFGRTVAEVSGTDMTDWLTRHIYTTDELNYQPALDWFGLAFPASKDADASDGEASDVDTTSDRNTSAPPQATDPESAAGVAEDKKKKPEPWLGVKLSSAGDGLRISGVEHGSPAHAAGLNVGDEILAFNDYRASSSNWSRQLKQLGVGETVTVLLARRGLIRTLEVEVQAEPQREWSLKPVKQPSDEQKIRLQQWLRIADPDDEPETEE